MEIKQAVAAASRAVMKSPMAILEMIAIKSDGYSMSFTSSNTEIGISTTADADAGFFSCCVLGNQLSNIVSSMTDPKFSMKDDKLVIRDKRSRFSLNTVPFENHPGLPDERNQSVISVDDDLCGLMAKTAYAASKTNVRPAINGVCIESNGATVTATATDGYRMAKASIASISDKPFSIIIPERCVSIISNFDFDYTEIGSSARFYGKDIVVSSRAIDAKYPDFSRTLNFNRQSINVQRSDLIDAIKVLNKLRDTETETLLIGWDSDQMTIQSRSQKVHESIFKFQCSSDESGEFSAMIKFMSDMVQHIKSDTVQIEFAEQSPSTKPLQITDSGTTHIVMPCRL